MLVRSALWDLWHEGCGRVADTAWGKAECFIMPRDHNPSAINLVKHELTNIKWFIVAPWPTWAVHWLLTVSSDIARTISAIQHALDYAIYGQGSAFDVAHEVTIITNNSLIVLERQLQILTFPLSSSQSQSSLPFRFLAPSILLLSIVFFSPSQDLTMWRRVHSSITTQHKQSVVCLFCYFKWTNKGSQKTFSCAQVES